MKLNFLRNHALLLLGFITFIGIKCSPISPQQNDQSNQTDKGMIVGVIFNEDGSFAQNAKISFRKRSLLADTSVAMFKKLVVSDTATVTTNDNGKFVIDSIDTGTYVILSFDGTNNLALSDSVTVKSKDSTLNLPNDTLKPAGAIKGIIKLPEGGDPRKVIVLAFGVDRFAKVNSDGSFKISSLAEGKYDLRLISSLDNYGVVDTVKIPVKSADTTNLDTIEMPYTGIPTPKNVKISYDTLRQISTLSWNKTDTNMINSFNVYRRNIDSNTVLIRINMSPIIDTFYRDSSGTQDQSYEYKVAAVSKTDNEGTKSPSISNKVTSALTFVKEIGTIGSGVGNYSTPSAISADSNKILIADYDQGKILFFNTMGVFLKEVTGFSKPCGLVINKNSKSVFVLEAETRQVKCIDSTGNLQFVFGGKNEFGEQNISWNLVIGENGYLYVPDRDDNRIKVFDSMGIIRDTIMVFSPGDISFIGNNKIIVGSHSVSDGTNKMTIIDTNGVVLKEWETSLIYDISPTLNKNIFSQNVSTDIINAFSYDGSVLLKASMSGYLGHEDFIRAMSADRSNHLFTVNYRDKKVRMFSYPSQL